MAQGKVLSSRNEVIEKFIKEKIAPGIVAHGGSVQIVSLENNILTLSLSGACVGCGTLAYTSDAIANYLLESFPDLEDVIVAD